MIRLPLTVQLDASDRAIFERAAGAGEWAVPGSFAFLDLAEDEITGKRRTAFQHGFLGTASFGWSTLVMVAEASAEDERATTETLARHFVERHGAPGLAAARAVAAREVAFARGLCEHPVGTLLTLYRQHGPDGVVEQFATVTRDADGQMLDLVAMAAGA